MVSVPGTFKIPKLVIPESATPAEAAALIAQHQIATLEEESRIRDARGYLEALLTTYGLESLTGWAIEQIREGNSPDMVMQLMRERQEFRDRFPAIFAREEAGLTPISPAEYVEYERAAQRMFRAAGLPGEFWSDRDVVTGLLTADVSVQELSQRVSLAFDRVASAPEAVRREFEGMFGAFGDAALATFFLDPDRSMPALERAAASAEYAGAGAMFGFSVASRAQDAARMGFTFDSALAGFRQAAQLRPLVDRQLAWERGELDQDDLLDAVFGVSDGDALRRRQEGRLSAFQGGARPMLGEQGALQAGTATRVR
jgi:hypothetical protein